MRQGVRNEPDLNVDRLLLHQPQQMLDLGTRMRAALAALAFGQVEAAGQPVLQQSTDFRSREKIDDAGRRCAIGRPCAAQGWP